MNYLKAKEISLKLNKYLPEIAEYSFPTFNMNWTVKSIYFVLPRVQYIFFVRIGSRAFHATVQEQPITSSSALKNHLL